MSRGTVFRVICVLFFVINIREVHDPSTCEVQNLFKSCGHKSPDIDQIPAALIKARVRTILY
jgi:hypothetical protein